MSFEDIPEDKEESYPCPNCERGKVTLSEYNSTWECDACNWNYEQMEIGNE